MEVEHSGPVLRTRRNLQAPTKQVKPAAPKKSVSVAALFKQPAHRSSKASIAPQPTAKIPPLPVEDASDEKDQSLKSRSSSHSPHKEGRKVPTKQSDMHPLAVEFRETSDDYRRHLFRSITLKIDQTLETLLHNLYESSLQPVSSVAEGSQDEPLRLTVPAKYERAAQKLYLPISSYRISLKHTTTDGERIPVEVTLGTRMQDFEDRIEEQTAEIEQNMKTWETIVGEIWKVGVQCLGEDVMEAMLFTNVAGHAPSSSPSKVAVAESTLFVPEFTSPPRKTRSKKRVTFEVFEDEEELPTASNASLDFLYQPTRVRAKAVPVVPAVSEQDIKNLEWQIKELGKTETEMYRKAERDYQAHWQKKTAQLLKVFED